ncbi:MAG: DUF971 domain-containing protein [Acidimicrobiales bacterium]
MAADPTDVASITVDRDSHVEVTFADGRACRYELVELRMACPCAGCRNAREQGREPWRPAVGRPLAIADAELIGAWGLRITWSDGHSTGIYPFESLRRWCEAGTASSAFGADSGLG